MGDFKKKKEKTLRKKVSRFFEDIFVGNEDVLVGVRDFILAKTPIDLHPKVVAERSLESEETTPSFQFRSAANGDSVDLEHRLREFVERPLERLRSEKIFAGQRCVPSNELIVAAINYFSRKNNEHFFRDGLYLYTVFAKEMSMRLTKLLKVRRWLLNNKQGKISIYYRHIGSCLRLLEGEGATNYFKVFAMFDHLYSLLDSGEIWPIARYEKKCSDELRAKKKRKIENLTQTFPGSQQKNGSDEDVKEDVDYKAYTDFFKESSQLFSLPMYGQVELRDVCKKSSTIGKLLCYQQTLQLGLSAVKVCFDKAIPGMYTKDDGFLEQLFCVIFFECSDRRMMLEGIQELLMFCKDEEAIREKKDLLMAWIREDPATILQKARLKNTATPIPEYLSELDELIRSTFKTSCNSPDRRTIARERIILRYVVYMQLQTMGWGKWPLPQPQPAVGSSPNPDTKVEPSTPVEAPVSCRLKDSEPSSEKQEVAPMLAFSKHKQESRTEEKVSPDQRPRPIVL